MTTLARLASELEAGRTTSRDLVEESLARISDPQGEGRRAILVVHDDAARAAAEAIDRARALGLAPTPYAGIPITVKDLFDVAGEVTRAGSKVLADSPPAAADAPVIGRLRAAGLVIMGRTNMTEFAYSGLGVNPHFGTPKNPFDRSTGRIPGGSTSGGAVSVADAMAVATLGTDTGGSCRIPAALCGIVGFKSTAERLPREGIIPLSPSLDSVGPLANSVACCAVLDAILAGLPPEAPEPFPVAGLRLGAPRSYVLEGLDETVARVYGEALSRLSGAGARIVEMELKELLEIPEINPGGALIAAEAYAWHRTLLETKADLYDPWIKGRLMAGMAHSAADYIALCDARADFIVRVGRLCEPFDALVMPTVPVIAPPIADMEDSDTAIRTNKAVLRNTALGNFLDRCAISIPCHEPGAAPVGLMLVGKKNRDRRLLAIARGVEAVGLGGEP